MDFARKHWCVSAYSESLIITWCQKWNYSMASSSTLPPPPQLDIHHSNAAEKWKQFALRWKHYSLALELSKKDEDAQVGTLLTIIGPEAQEVYTTFEWENEGDEEKIQLHGTGPVQSVLRTEEEHTVREVLFQSEATANRRNVRSVQNGFEEACRGVWLHQITPDEILRDRLLFGIADNKVRERLLRETNLTLEKTDDLCHASERMAAQLKIVADKQTPPAEAANAVSTGKRNVTRSKPQARRSQTKEIDCSYCGQRLAQKKSCVQRMEKNALPAEKTTTLPTSAAHRHDQRRGRSTTLTTRCSQRRGRLTSKSRS